MGTPRKPYIDDEGVRRGWYVYLHRDNASDEVFYVGMGTDRRAWDTINRNERWKQRVENLADGYSVEILEDDLTESAAGLLEARTVARYGSVGEGSPLTNIAMGGSATSIQVSLETLGGSDGMIDAIKMLTEAVKEYGPEILQPYEEFEILSIGRDEALSLLADLEVAQQPLLDRRGALLNELYDHEDMRVSDLADILDVDLNSIEAAIADYRERQLSWNDFCEFFSKVYQSIRYAYDDFKDEEPETTETIDNMVALAAEVLALYAAFMKQVVRSKD